MWIVDRLEGDWVVCEKEDGTTEALSRSLFDGEIREGDCLKAAEGRFSADPEATRARREQMKQRFSRVLQKRPKPGAPRQ